MNNNIYKKVLEHVVQIKNSSNILKQKRQHHMNLGLTMSWMTNHREICNP